MFAAQRRGEILLSDEAVAEIVEVLHRPKFDRYVLPDERDWFFATLIRQAKLVLPTERICVCRDAKDDKWLEIAVEGNAALMISGDKDLLQLKSFRNIPIVTPADFIASLKE